MTDRKTFCSREFQC